MGLLFLSRTLPETVIVSAKRFEIKSGIKKSG